MAEDKRTIVVPIKPSKLGIVTLCSFIFWTLIVSDPVYERPAEMIRDKVVCCIAVHPYFLLMLGYICCNK